MDFNCTELVKRQGQNAGRVIFTSKAIVLNNLPGKETKRIRLYYDLDKKIVAYKLCPMEDKGAFVLKDRKMNYPANFPKELKLYGSYVPQQDDVRGLTFICVSSGGKPLVT